MPPTQGDQLNRRKLERDGVLLPSEDSVPMANKSSFKSTGSVHGVLHHDSSASFKSSNGAPLSPSTTRGLKKSTSMYSKGDYYSRPDLDAMAEQVVQQSIQRQKELEEHKRGMVQINRQRTLDTLTKRKLERMVLEVQAGSRDILEAEAQGVTVPTRAPRPPRNHNANHQQFLEAHQTKIRKQLDHRASQMAGMRERIANRRYVEAKLGTPFSRTVAAREAAGASGSPLYCPPISARSGRTVTQDPPCTEDDQIALAQLDNEFEERKQECYANRFAGKRKKENLNLDLHHDVLTDAAFTTPMYN